MPALPPLPIDGHIPAVLEHLRVHRAAVLVAAPGAGKTTRVPPAIADAGRVLVLQPRRAAARSLARRVADEQGWTLGREVGWHVRFESRFSRDTAVIFATEGILTARLQQDPLLGDIATVVLDEFHERSVHADLGLALAKQAWLAREDLRLLVMSATLDAAPVSAFLSGCPVLTVPGEPHALQVTYAPDTPLGRAVADVLRDTHGAVLCFLPGAREIDAAMREVRPVAQAHAADVVPLHGTLSAEAQDAALSPVDRRRVFLATNIAETSVTVPGVRAVIDTGWQKVARYDATRGIDTLQTERVSADAADQRAGRAARLGPGVAVRLWHERDRLRAFREPDLLRVDLAPVLLAVLAWGGDIVSFDWFEPPPRERVREAVTLLGRLGAVQASSRLTEVGHTLAKLPLSPRLARLIVEARGHPDACLAAALLSEGRVPTPDGRTTVSDLLSLLPGARAMVHLRRAADAIARSHADAAIRANRRPEVQGAARSFAPPLDDVTFCRALLAGFPDRVAQRRAPDAARDRGAGDALLLASGTGAQLAPSSGVRDAEYLVALEVRGIEGREAQIAVASAVDRDWLTPTHESRRVWVDGAGRLRAVRQQRYDALVLREQPDALRADDRTMLADAWRAAARRDDDAQLLARLAFAGSHVDLATLLEAAVRNASTLSEVDLEAALPWDIRQAVLTQAPVRLPLPSGRTAALSYGDDGSVRAAVKLQELFGLVETPRVGPRAEPVLLELLAPNGRPVQTTRDLRSFWTTTYAEVRKELRGRYPKHPWPEDPWTARATPKGQGKREEVKRDPRDK